MGELLSFGAKIGLRFGPMGFRGSVEWLGKWNWLELPTNWLDKDVCQQRLTFFIFFFA